MPTVRKSILCAATLAAKPAASAWLATYYGDTPGTDEMVGRYYEGVSGADPTVQTHAVSCMPSSTVPEETAVGGYFTTQAGCTFWSATRTTPNPDFNALLLSLWNLKPCVPVTP